MTAVAEQVHETGGRPPTKARRGSRILRLTAGVNAQRIIIAILIAFLTWQVVVPVVALS